MFHLVYKPQYLIFPPLLYFQRRQTEQNEIISPDKRVGVALTH